MYENGGTEYQRCQAGAAAAERCKKHKILRKLLPVCLILFIGLTLVKNRFLFVSISEYGFGDPATQGGLWGSDWRPDAQRDFCGCHFWFLLYAGL